MLRTLVEEATHPEALENSPRPSARRFKVHRRHLAPWKSGWLIWPRQLYGGLRNQGEPLSVPADNSRPPPNPHPVRGGGSLARFGQAFDSPFGNKVQILTVPAAWSQGLPEDATVKVVKQEKGAIAFDLRRRPAGLRLAGLAERGRGPGAALAPSPRAQIWSRWMPPKSRFRPKAGFPKVRRSRPRSARHPACLTR